MEQPLPSELFSLNIDPLAKSYLSETARWGRFLAIVGFIICGLVLILGVFFNSFFSYLPRTGDTGMENNFNEIFGALSTAMTTIYILFAILYFFPCLFLYRFSNKMKVALNTNSQQDLNNSFQNLKSLFKYVGVFTIIILAIYALAIILIIIGASFSR